jgi:hypothetical protein
MKVIHWHHMHIPFDVTLDCPAHFPHMTSMCPICGAITDCPEEEHRPWRPF